MIRTKSAFLVLVALLLSPMAANAALVIDQNNPLTAGNLGFDYLASSNYVGQSFQQDADNIAGAGIVLGENWSGSGMITISIWEQYVGGLAGFIASSTSGIVNQNSGWVDVFWDAVAITPATMYYMVLESTDPRLVVSFDTGYSSGNYAAGISLANLVEGPYGGYDLPFRTYADDMLSVPTTATLYLFGLGLAGLGWSRRKKT